jgi:rRNA maturation endonuclease Nob1
MPFFDGGIEMEKVTRGETFNPQKYGMSFCPDCHGAGKAFNSAKEINVCRVCGGFGLIKKEENNSLHNRLIIESEFVTQSK